MVADPAQGFVYQYVSLNEIYILPSQCQQLTLAQRSSKGQRYDRMQHEVVAAVV